MFLLITFTIASATSPAKIKSLIVFPSPQTVSLTVVGGVNQIANIEPIDILVIVDFNLWELEKNFYSPDK